MSVHYPPDETTILGRPAELLALHLAGAPLAAWGAHEPATLQWDPIAFTETARRRMPGDLRLVLAGPGVHMTSLIKRTRTGVEETVSGVALLGPASMDLDTVGGQAANGLAAVAHEVPLAIFRTVTATARGCRSHEHARSGAAARARRGTYRAARRALHGVRRRWAQSRFHGTNRGEASCAVARRELRRRRASAVGRGAKVCRSARKRSNQPGVRAFSSGRFG